MIELHNVDLKLGSKEIFHNYDLKIRSAEKLVINSPSGAGKTSLFRLILGFQLPDQGAVYVNDLAVIPKNISTIRNSISYLSQDIDLPQIKTSDLITRIFDYQNNRNKKPENDKLLKILNNFMLSSDHLEKNIAELSGGEKQRIGLVICFLLDRKILLLDEPTSALDKTIKDKIIAHILNTNKTILIISHDEVWQKHREELRFEDWITR